MDRDHLLIITFVLFACLLAFSAATGANALDRYMENTFPVAGSFERPSAAFAASRSVLAVASGRVKSATADSVLIEHVYYENFEKKRVDSRYAHLSGISVKVGDHVARGQAIGVRGERTKVDLDGRDVRAFIAAHPHVFDPGAEVLFVLIDQESAELRVYERGVLVKTAEIGLGQGTGPKIRQGDLKTPKGMYFVLEKRHGKFSGDYGEYYGGYWIKLNYPNAFDAARGLAEGWIDASRANSIAKAWWARSATDQRTKLGGGIGMHGWIEEWVAPDGGAAHLSWGCVVMHLRDVADIFERVPIGATVVII